MNAICLVIDRLHVGHVGAYGNAWIDTPSLDGLAARSITFDQALVDSPSLQQVYRSYWHGWHAVCPHAAPDDRPSLPALLGEAGVNTTLLTDDRSVAEHRLALDFDELVELEPPWEPQLAAEMEQTHLARCCVQVMHWLDSAREPFLLWCHLGALESTWDAPLDWRRRYQEPGDPEPYASAAVPDLMLQPDHDPDELFSLAQAYAGQMAVLDACLGVLLECIESSPAGQAALLALTAPRGFPLGEHLRVGSCDEALYAELVHVPLLLRFPEGRAAAARSQALVEPGDLWATLLEWWNVAQPAGTPSASSLMPIVRDETAWHHDRLAIAGRRRQRAVRTPAWYLRCDDGRSELFAKPDDAWEVNEVADRCREVVDCLQDVLGGYEEALRSGTATELPPLAEVLLRGLE